MEKLHEIERVLLPGNANATPAEWSPKVQRYFQTKWKCSNRQRSKELWSICNAALPPIEFSEHELDLLGGCLNKRSRLHRNGTCGEMVRLLAYNNSAFTTWFNSAVSQTATWTSLNITGYLKGKASTPGRGR